MFPQSKGGLWKPKPYCQILSQKFQGTLYVIHMVYLFSTVGAENMQKVPQRVLVPALSAPDQTKCGESKSLTLFKLGGAIGGSRSDATMRR